MVLIRFICLLLVLLLAAPAGATRYESDMESGTGWPTTDQDQASASILIGDFYYGHYFGGNPDGRNGYWARTDDQNHTADGSYSIRVQLPKSPTRKLNFDGQTGNFTLGQVVTGTSSGATATILYQIDNGATGSLYLINKTGTFLNDEPITDPLGGVAAANGGDTSISSWSTANVSYRAGSGGRVTMSEGIAGFWFYIPENMPLGSTKFLDRRFNRIQETVLPFTGQTANFTPAASSHEAGETITGAVSGASGRLVAQTDNGTTGTLYLTGVSGTFNASEAITGSLGGAATTNGATTVQSAPFPRYNEGVGINLWKHATDGEYHLSLYLPDGSLYPAGGSGIRYLRHHLCIGEGNSNYIDVTRGVWHHLKVYWKCTGNSPTGKMKMWYDGQPAYTSYGAWENDEGQGTALLCDWPDYNWLADELNVFQFLLNEGPTCPDPNGLYIYMDDIYIDSDPGAEINPDPEPPVGRPHLIHGGTIKGNFR